MNPNLTRFCHIAPTPHLDLVRGRPFHLALAHLVEEDARYREFYQNEKSNGSTIILDNSAYEMYTRGQPMYAPDKLITMGRKINADYIVMTDYPGEDWKKTVDWAKDQAPQFRRAGFGTFFVPQSAVGDFEGCIEGFEWAAKNPGLINYVGISILQAPNAFDANHSALQRYLARNRLLASLMASGLLDQFYRNGQKIHLLGMTEGPAEIYDNGPYHKYITTWDSSAAIWTGLNGVAFDDSPTGLRDGKYKVPVDFDRYCHDERKLNIAKNNMAIIDELFKRHIQREHL